MPTLEVESVISNEIISEFSQKASGTAIWSDCSNWLNEQRTFTELRNYAPSWFSMLIVHTSSEELLKLASDDPRQDTRYSVAINSETPRYLLQVLVAGASQWVKEAALANPKMGGFEVGQAESAPGWQLVSQAEI